MCQPVPSLNYSPKTLVALMVSDGGSTAGTEGGSGGGSAMPPSGPSPQASWRNLTQPMPLGKKIRLVVRNTSIKVKTGQPCCGHPGEPGC